MGVRLYFQLDERRGSGHFVLGPKAIHAAEAFVLGLFQLYPTIYFHKTTRGAEQLFTELLVKTVTLAQQSSGNKTGLPQNHPLIRFANNPESIETALTLDDTVVWGALTLMCDADDKLISNFAKRLRDRSLYKCSDARMWVEGVLDPGNKNSDEAIAKIDKCCAEISVKLQEWSDKHSSTQPRILLDSGERSPYKSIGESKGPLDRINIRTESGALVDLKERSNVVAALKKFKLFRAYSDRSDTEALGAITAITEQEIETCRTQAP